MDTYERIKQLCDENGTSISKLCIDITGSSGNTSTWKKGNIRNDYLIKIAERFNVTTDYLLGKSDSPHPSTNSDDELWELRRIMSEKPGARTLFSLSKTADNETLEFAGEMIKRMQKESGYGDE